ncbi:hypothetical protein [Rhodobacter ferrooxidans]|uniref:Gamma-glutamyl kinase n=1 Tax=Rhodobacter ferrooxidans TaxID=371731 RepID=C8RXU9_9RHOB|nr:hypothetical protein [Rhodobacter sp. SW2]EEW26347.1 conserved hypothetical protein [Rhodobacter sp. SW2]
MLVFWAQRLTLLATPKTGTTALEAALESHAAVIAKGPPALKHTSAQRYHRFVAPWLSATAGEDFTVLAVMREPRDWLGSWYRYRQRPEIGRPARSTAAISFDDFVRAWCQDKPPEFANVGSQARFLAGKNGRGADRLFRYDQIGSLVEFLQAQLGCTLDIPRLNVSPPGDDALSPQTEALLRQFAASDFALYQTIA